MPKPSLGRVVHVIGTDGGKGSNRSPSISKVKQIKRRIAKERQDREIPEVLLAPIPPDGWRIGEGCYRTPMHRIS